MAQRRSGRISRPRASPLDLQRQLPAGRVAPGPAAADPATGSRTRWAEPPLAARVTDRLSPMIASRACRRLASRDGAVAGAS